MSSPPDKEFALPRFSIRRKSTQINLSMLLVTLLAILINIASHHSFSSVQGAVQSDLAELLQYTGTAATDDTMHRTAQAIATGRSQLLIIGVATTFFAVFTTFQLITVGRRSIALEVWIRRMGAGDLDYRVEMSSKDEITKLAIALEDLRQRSIQALQLDLVQKLSQDLQEKNEELERVLLELRQTQDQIVLRQKLAALGELTASVAHEIRNPLNFVKNFSEASEELLDELLETLDDSTSDLDDDKRRLITAISQDLAENMEHIRSHSDRADRIVHDMLLLGQGGGEFRPTDINNLLGDRALFAYQSARTLDQDFQLNIRDDFDPNMGEVSIISEDMGRAFLNMIDNACYATDEKRRTLAGTGEAYTPTLWLKTKRQDDTIEIHIRDNGSGISPDIITKIFDPFFTTKPPGKGTGLGLSLANDIVRQHGGSITALSDSGEYTEITISLPVSANPLPDSG